VNYDEWLAAVDTTLRAQKRGVKVTDIDKNALQEAFENDVSPVVFAQNPMLPIQRWKPDSNMFEDSKALPILVSLLIIVLAVWWAKGYVGSFFRDRTMATVKYPLNLPVKGENGVYWPEQTHEAEAEACELIKEFLMTPRDATNIKATAKQMPTRSSFLIDGKVASKNKYGTVIDAPFTMTLQFSEQSLAQGILKFKMTNIDLGISGDTNIWNRTDLSPFSQSRVARPSSGTFKIQNGKRVRVTRPSDD
jgi:hypothetical protein